ncbi:8040_t:CDS:2 [Acaulospora morrowiae]|uniref:8040_t:CDS:1 n=1 Tax=Acaulospora morrowiae TaxID=94023 RepID=A0A9N8WH81_9GLOM|nr:8040_t:CDS:2 [Acaulospora morrowiae]
MATTKLLRPARLYFTTNPRTVKSLTESKAVFSYFDKIGPLLEFKFGRVFIKGFEQVEDTENKKILKFGWVSYKDNEISKKLLSSETLSLPEPLSFDIKFEESIHEAVYNKPPPHRYKPRFSGFYINRNSPQGNIDASRILDLFSSPSSMDQKGSLENEVSLNENENDNTDAVEEKREFDEITEETIEESGISRDKSLSL